MANEVKFSSSAQLELEEASEWYEDRSAGLGEIFAEVVYQAAATISRDPEAYSNKRKKIREFLIEKFPYLIVYEYQKESGIINILHVFHTSRDPKYKYKSK